MKEGQPVTPRLIHYVKDYKIGRKSKIKGISKTAKKVSDNEYITYQQQGIRASLHNKNVNTMTWHRVPKKLSRIYEKAIVTHDELISPLIMKYTLGENWLDYEAMREQYGKYATHRDRYLDDIMRRTSVSNDFDEGSLEDYSLEAQRQMVIDDVEARRRGEMIYQRGR